MSFSVDDLVASFGTSHIGQEQMDLQAFRAQMAKHLQTSNHMPSSIPMPVRRNSVAQPYASSPVQTNGANEEDRDDEMMVEDMLVAPGSPVATSAASLWTNPPQQQQQHLQWTPAPAPAPAFNQMHTSQPPQFVHGTPQQQQRAQEQSSLFTTTDPFYLSLTQRVQNSTPYFSHAHHGSVFQMDSGMVLVDR